MTFISVVFFTSMWLKGVTEQIGENFVIGQIVIIIVIV